MSLPPVSRLFAALLLALPAVAQPSIQASAEALAAQLPQIDLNRLPVANAEALIKQIAPPRSVFATLSRDGRHLAFTVNAGGQTRVDVVATDAPYEKQSIFLGDIRGAQIHALHWTSSDRLVLATEDWAIVTLSLADGSARIVLDPDRFSARIGDDYDADSRDNPLGLETYARPPRLLRLAPDADDEVIVEGVVGTHLRNAIATTARLNLVTGEWKRIDTVRITEPANRMWTDAQGRYRLLLDRTNLPMSWRVRATDDDGDLRGWRSLRSVLPDTLADAFSVDAKRLWTDRAVPLGFGADSRLLFFATNLGQDTYGIRAWDFATGSPAALEIDHPAVDLAPPVADFAPRLLGLHERNQRRNNPAVYYTDFSAKPPPNPLVFDRADPSFLVGVRTPVLAAGAHWLDPTLADLQVQLEADHPGRAVQILDWDDRRQRFLVNVSTEASTGRYYLYRTADDAWVELFRRDAIDREDERHVVETFVLPADADHPTPLRGRLTLPRMPLGKRPPLVCFLPDGPWQQPHHARSAPAQMLAEFGCVVLEFEPQNVAGRGTAALLRNRDQPAEGTTRELDRALAWLEGRQPFNPNRVGLIGVGYGGWLALRVAELRSGRIRAVASLNGFDDLDYLFTAPPPRERLETASRGLERANNIMQYFDAVRSDLDRLAAVTSGAGSTEPTDARSFSATPRSDEFETPSTVSESSPFASRLAVAQRMDRAEELTPASLQVGFARWFFGRDAAKDPAYSVTEHIADLQSAVFLCASPDRENRPVDDTRRIASALERVQNPADVWIMPASPWGRPLADRSEVWLRVAAFLNETLVNFDVQIGTVKEVKE